MKNDPAALAVACVTMLFETREAGGGLNEQAVALRMVLNGLETGELAGVIATMSAWLVSELPEDQDEARQQLRSMGLFFGETEG